MSQVQLGFAFLIPSGVTGSEEATNHPATNAGIVAKWRRTARSTTLTSPWTLTFDFGTTVTPPGFFLNNANFGTLKAAVASSSGGPWTELYPSGISLRADDRVPPRRKGWYPASEWAASWTSLRYFRLQASAPDSGETSFALGTAAFPSPVNPMTRNWAPPEFTPREPLTRLPYPGGGSEGNVEGPTLVAFDLVYGPNFKDQLAQLHTLRALGQDVPFFMYENRGDLAHAYVLKRIAEVRFSEQYAALQATPWTFEEAV